MPVVTGITEIALDQALLMFLCRVRTSTRHADPGLYLCGAGSTRAAAYGTGGAQCGPGRYQQGIR